ncbi:MAG: VOC family protein [Flavisolibacter sp.]
MQKITPFLWFDNNAEEAVNFYTSVFKDAKVGSMARYGEAGPGQKGQVMTATFKLFGQEFIVLNGGPQQFKFNESISFVISCENQEEIDYYWEKLSEGGEKSRCGWLKDKFGLSWQVVPANMGELLQNKDPEKSKRIKQAMMQMDKLDIKKLQEA